MKTNALHFVSFLGTSFAIAVFLVIVGAISTAKAQSSLPNFRPSDINGLFTPTAADRFFEEGRRNMEREREILTRPERYSHTDILQFNTVDLKIVDETGKEIPISDFLEDSPQQELK
ncbi:hypothetical protein Xen7305DRAFT_00022120 [Xenococcus sp. PCC 7305]|uniref:hypothetical protein n=1 Tax=Xenococcus sp. PCC 7305 TaxID=102125 RepID=UPI0002ACE8C2|nr:hypothetical protein [Xenococcus sp. PCC 7305]ELS02498.1 hypothetical protein Xen7305DRAFT_00022120 [Xenococcus sp. PCC 7305]